MQIINIEEPSQNISDKEQIVVGIDFGTTNSLIAISQEGKPKTIKLANDSDICPSIVSFGSSLLVGQKQEKYISSIKRYLAKNSSDIEQSPVLSRHKNLFDLSSSFPMISVGQEKFTPTALAAEIIRYLVDSAQKQLKTEISQAVISVPAYFDDNARGQIISAAKLAGVEVLRLIAEPTAAAYAYGMHKKREGTYLVYDLGGGTFDVSVLNMMSGILQVVAIGGDSMLGGDDVDLLLAEYLQNKYSIKIDSELISFAKTLKEKMSAKEDISEIFQDAEIRLTYSEFKDAILPLIKQTIKIALDTFEDANIEKIDGVILVGGSTRMPLIKEQLSSNFDCVIYDDLDPDRIVALGAAMQAENLSSKANALLVDVVPLSIGIELYGSLTEKLIWRNTPLPFSITKEFTTHVDNQTGIMIHVVQGERERVESCLSLAKFELKDIRPQRAGKARIIVKFAMDADGILSVSAQDHESGKAHNIDIRPAYGIAEENILANLQDAYNNISSDHEERLFLESKIQAESLINGLVKALEEEKDIITPQLKQDITSSIGTVKENMELQDRDELDRSIEQLNKLASEFIHNYLNLGADLYLKGKNINNIDKD